MASTNWNSVVYVISAGNTIKGRNCYKVYDINNDEIISVIFEPSLKPGNYYKTDNIPIHQRTLGTKLILLTKCEFLIASSYKKQFIHVNKKDISAETVDEIKQFLTKIYAIAEIPQKYLLYSANTLLNETGKTGAIITRCVKNGIFTSSRDKDHAGFENKSENMYFVVMVWNAVEKLLQCKHIAGNVVEFYDIVSQRLGNKLFFKLNPNGKIYHSWCPVMLKILNKNITSQESSITGIKNLNYFPVKGFEPVFSEFGKAKDHVQTYKETCLLKLGIKHINEITEYRIIKQVNCAKCKKIQEYVEYAHCEQCDASLQSTGAWILSTVNIAMESDFGTERMNVVLNQKSNTQILSFAEKLNDADIDKIIKDNTDLLNKINMTKPYNVYSVLNRMEHLALLLSINEKFIETYYSSIQQMDIRIIPTNNALYPCKLEIENIIFDQEQLKIVSQFNIGGQHNNLNITLDNESADTMRDNDDHENLTNKAIFDTETQQLFQQNGNKRNLDKKYTPINKKQRLN